MRILMAAFMIAFGPSAAAEDAMLQTGEIYTESYFSGETFLDLCRSQQPVAISGCWRYINGVIDALSAASSMTDGKVERLCIPTLATNPDRADRVKGYLLLHPEEQKSNAASVVIKALREAWPCTR